MKKAFLIFMLFFLAVASAFAEDWVSLHNQADKLNSLSQVASVNIEDKLYISGLICLNQHRDKEAAGFFRQLEKLNPRSIGAEWGIAEVLRRQHKITESEKMLKEIISQDKDFSPAYISLAYIQYRQMKLNEAVSSAAYVIRQGKDKVDLSNYVRSLLITGGAKGMIAHYGGPLSKIINGTAVLPLLRRAERLKPADGAVFFGLGSFYLLAPHFAGGDIEQAELYLEKAVKTEPQFSDAYVRLAQVYKIKKDQQKYNFYLNKALQIDPQNDLAIDVKNNTCKFICIGQ